MYYHFKLSAGVQVFYICTRKFISNELFLGVGVGWGGNCTQDECLKCQFEKFVALVVFKDLTKRSPSELRGMRLKASQGW